VLRILPGAPRALAPALTQTRLTRIWTSLLAVIRLSVCRLPVPAGCGRRLALPRWVSPAGGERLIEPLRAQRRRTWRPARPRSGVESAAPASRPAAAGPAYAARLTGETTRATARSIGRTGRRPVATPCRLGRGPARGRGIGRIRPRWGRRRPASDPLPTGRTSRYAGVPCRSLPAGSFRAAGRRFWPPDSPVSVPLGCPHKIAVAVLSPPGAGTRCWLAVVAIMSAQGTAASLTRQGSATS
jgi:hypothetical protein